MPGEEGVGKSSETVAQPPGAHAPVFISYASQDADTANAICQSLESHGVSCWIAPRDVKPGAQYADAIVRAINEARAVVLVMSASAVGSSHVGREVERAASKHKQIIAFRIDVAPLSPGLEYFLSESQWIDVPKLGMPAALAKLKEAVGQGAATWPPNIPAGKNASGSKKRIVIAAAVIIGIVAAVAIGLHFWTLKHGGAQTPAVAAITDKSIAVLPFVDMSEKKDQEYFGDGIAEEIIDLLVKDPGLKVIGRTSSFQFKGKTEDLRSIGMQLGVAYLLEGSVRKSGDRLRVTAQLIDSRNGTHVWSQTYDRDVSDILKMQDEIAIKVVRALEVEVNVSDVFAHPSLRNAEAYKLFLRGEHAEGRFEPQGWEQAVSDYQRALELDPTFAYAAGSLAGVYMFGGLVGYMPRATAFEQANHFAELAIKLDPNDAEAHVLLGDIYNQYSWDWNGVDRQTKRALALAPNDPNVLMSAAAHSLTQGQLDVALKQINAAVEFDPLEPNNYFWLSLVQLRRGRLAEAEAAVRRTLELTPTYIFGPYILGLVLLARNQPQEALEAFQKEPSDGARLNGSALAYFALKRKADSNASLAQSIRSSGADFPAGIARVYAFRGESDEAFHWLERAYEQKDTLLYGIKFAPEFDKLHDDPRYKAFLKKMNLPE
jgi:TolB-like protein/Tfp pilus assembly protein PilF